MTIDKQELVLRNLAIWTLVCVVSAAPSLVIAVRLADFRTSAILGMLTGVALFILGYTALASSDWAQQAPDPQSGSAAERAGARL